MKIGSYESIIRCSGIYDIVLMIPFAIPGVVWWTMSQMQIIHQHFELSGNFPALSSFHLFFINVMAVITIVWSVLRVHRPMPKYGMYDTVARIALAILILYYLLLENVSEVLWLFFFSELIWATLQLYSHMHRG